MPIKIAVCDDEHAAASQIDAYLSQIQLETGLRFQVFYFSSAEDLLHGMPKDVKILLLDIQMGGMSGIEAARRLRAAGADFYLFFITSNTQYALEGYEVHAYAFLRKPLQYTLLKTYLLEVVEQIKNARPYTLILKNGAATEFVEAGRIIYIEVYGHAATFVFGEERKTFPISLNELETLLDDHGFFRCHKSYLINLRKISSVRAASILMENQDFIPLSKHRKQEFFIELQKILGG